jgi:hypothetical protein
LPGGRRIALALPGFPRPVSASINGIVPTRPLHTVTLDTSVSRPALRCALSGALHVRRCNRSDRRCAAFV